VDELDVGQKASKDLKTKPMMEIAAVSLIVASIILIAIGWRIVRALDLIAETMMAMATNAENEKKDDLSK
jgi:cell division protein FtsX